MEYFVVINIVFVKKFIKYIFSIIMNLNKADISKTQDRELFFVLFFIYNNGKFN